jgi:hypothetical protein
MADDTPLLDMVVKRISEEVASVLKVDPSNVEEHLGVLLRSASALSSALTPLRLPGTCLADEVVRHGDRNKAVVAKAGIWQGEAVSGDLDSRLRGALSRLEDRKAQRLAHRETAPIPLRKKGAPT